MKNTYWALVVAILACSPTPTPQPPPQPDPQPPIEEPDAGSDTPESQACANLKALGCPEGIPPDCSAMMKLRCSNPKVKCDTACLVEAKSKGEVWGRCRLACGVE